MKPRIFIGSSTNGLSIAELAQAELKHDGQPELWTNGVFRSIKVPIENLIAAVSQYQFALFILLPEDPLSIRDEETISVRDNVLFELGLFMGKLGRHRNFFIMPQQATEKSLHLPSDLSGITPSTYDPRAANVQASVGTALREFKQMLRESNKLLGKVIVDSNEAREYHFEHRGGHDVFKDDKPVDARGSGRLSFPEAGTLRIERTTSIGRYEIEFRPLGSKQPSIPRASRPERVFKVTFKAKVSDCSHQIRFVLKDIQQGRWVADTSVTVTSKGWEDFEFYLRAAPSIDLLLRVDDRSVAIVPSSVYLSSIRVVESD